MAEKYWVAEKKSVWASCNWKIVKSATWYIEVPSGWRPVMICSPLRPPHTGHWLLRRGRNGGAEMCHRCLNGASFDSHPPIHRPV